MLDDEDDGVDVFAELAEREERITKLEKRVVFLQNEVEGRNADIQALKEQDQSREIKNLRSDKARLERDNQHLLEECEKAKAMYRRGELDKEAQVDRVVAAAERLEKSKQPREKKGAR